MSKPTLEITTMIGCPLMCTYCPQEELRVAYGDDVKYMSLETFQTAVDKLPPECRLDFSGMAEPWVNPACTDMLEYALEQGRRVAIFTTLYNWDETTVHRVGQLLVDYADQIEIVKIHFPDEAGNMRGWKLTPEWEYAFIGIQTVVRMAGIHFEAMTMSDDGVHPAIRHLPGVFLSHNWTIAAHDRAGTLDKDRVKEQPIKFVTEHNYPITCSKTEKFNQNVLLPNGDVALCCMDYDTKHVIGNLIEQEYDDLFVGEEFVRLMEINAMPCFSKESLCKSCTDARRI